MIKPLGIFLFAALLPASPLLAQDTTPAIDWDDPDPLEFDSNGNPHIYPTLAAPLVDLGVRVLDVRSAEEIEQSGIVDGAENIPHDETDRIATFLGDDMLAAVVVYCGSGRRAAMVVDELRNRGYGGFVNAGGYEDIVAALEGPAEED
ncbi:MAG: rhodanese-like domain-containing protein [Wenzhouxiangellaceae bacterium]|nr:rhodanese-like domain-containing protein [Wenzhouxiangellaceae bacterium]